MERDGDDGMRSMDCAVQRAAPRAGRVDEYGRAIT
jgi:hypothetical protein